MKLSSIFDPLKGLFGQSNKAKILTTSKTSAGKLAQFDKSIGETMARGNFFTSTFNKEIYPTLSTFKEASYANPLDMQLISMPNEDTIAKIQKYNPYKSEAVLKNGVLDKTLLKKQSEISKLQSRKKNLFDENEILTSNIYDSQLTDYQTDDNFFAELISEDQKALRHNDIELAEVMKKIYNLKNNIDSSITEINNKNIFGIEEHIKYLPSESYGRNPFISTVKNPDKQKIYNSYRNTTKRLYEEKYNSLDGLSLKTPEEIDNIINNIDLNNLQKYDQDIQEWINYKRKQTHFLGGEGFSFPTMFTEMPDISQYKDIAKEGIHLYTDIGPKKNWSYPMNSYLSGRPISKEIIDAFPEEDILKNAKKIDAAIEHSPKHAGITYRYISIDDAAEYEDFIKQYDVGNIIQSRQYLSTTKARILDKDINMYGGIFDNEYEKKKKKNFKLKGGGERHYIIFQIESNSGADISRISHIPQQSEVLLPRNKQFRVIGTRERSGNIFEVAMKELDSAKEV